MPTPSQHPATKHVASRMTSWSLVRRYAAALGHRVIAFEPLEENYRMALASVHMNQGFSSRVMLFQRAAHWGTEPLVLARNPTNTHGFRNSGAAPLSCGPVCATQALTSSVRVIGICVRGRVRNAGNRNRQPS